MGEKWVKKLIPFLPGQNWGKRVPGAVFGAGALAGHVWLSGARAPLSQPPKAKTRNLPGRPGSISGPRPAPVQRGGVPPLRLAQTLPVW